MKRRRIAGVIILTLALLVGCGGESSDSSSAGYTASKSAVQSDGMAADAGVQAEMAEIDTDSTATSQDVSDTVQREDAGSGVNVQDTSRKLIKYEDYSIETKEFDQFTEELSELVSASEGYIEYSEVSGNDTGYEGNRYASYTLRIPVTKLDEFSSTLEKMGNVVRKSERVEDVTLNYVDTESHIKALKAEQESLMELLEKADSLESIIAIQSQLTQVRYQLESYESQMRTYDNAILYSTVSLYLDEVKRETETSDSFGAQLGERFSSSLYGIKEGFFSFLLVFLGGLPCWILLAAFIAVAVVIGKKICKKRAGKLLKKQKAENPKQLSEKEQTDEKGESAEDQGEML